MNRRFLSAKWLHLLMINYEVDPDIIRPLVPKGTSIDFWHGKTYLSLVGFRFWRTRLFGMAIPFHVNFDEINLRFYVQREAPDGLRRGVVFIKEVVPRWAVATVANWVYYENYVCRPMRSTVRIPERDSEGFVEYVWKNGERWNRLEASFTGMPAIPAKDSEAEFITEHYWGYNTQKDGSTLEYRVSHPQWRVWQTTKALLDCAVEDFYGSQYAETMRRPPSSAFVVDGSKVEVFQGVRLPAANISFQHPPNQSTKATGNK